MRRNIVVAIALGLAFGMLLAGSAQAEDTRVNKGLGPFCEIDRSDIDSLEWQDAIETAKSHMGKFGGFYSLFRIVFAEELSDSEMIRVKASKIKDLTKQYEGGGGDFRDVKYGGFVFVEHTKNPAVRQNKQDLVELKSLYRGQATILIDVPKRNELQLVGDIVIRSISNETCPDPIGLDDLLQVPTNGLLGKGYDNVAVISGQWEKEESDFSVKPLMRFHVTQVDGRDLLSPAKFDWVFSQDENGRQRKPLEGEVWEFPACEEIQRSEIEGAEAELKRPIDQIRKVARVILREIKPTLLRRD